MKTVNRIELYGRVGRDAEQKSDKAPIRFSVATGGEDKSDGHGKWPVVWHNVTAWPDQHPDARDIRKGECVRVIGRLNYTKWTGKDGGERHGVEIVATSITVDPKPEPPLTPNYHGVAVSDQDIPF